ncbi:MAG: AAA family ATPase [Bacteroidaceae bacterium]|nr:AAA family ATPase [Bacteroidaceae bacterium]
MGTYINAGNAGFQSSRNSEYVDKSGLISIVNSTLFSERRFSCVTRSRRFGKSMAAKMLCAYYDQSCDSRRLFADLQIAGDPSFEQHLNKYPVIFLDLSDFVTRFKDESIVGQMDDELKEDVHKAYPDVPIQDGDDLMKYLIRIVEAQRQSFIFIVDEWDAICREFEPGTPAMDGYLNWLRRMFKGGQTMQVFAAVYMTGILPVKKYKTQSAMNNFLEYSMVEPRNMARYFGFTKDEVRALAAAHSMDFDELEKWYDGYQIGDEHSIFNPNSVIQAVDVGRCRSYWASTGAYDAVADYIKMNYEGLKDDIIRMLADERCKVNPTKFQNDMSVIHSKDDVLTVLIHLGYLSYDWKKSECYIPNREVAGEMVNAVEANNWKPVVDALAKSEQLLQATLEGDEEAVVRGVDAAHDEHTSILSYNDENSLACVLSIAYYYARNDYEMHRELASGKGFADIVLIPRKNVDSPAIVLELKCNKNADAAIDQIKRRQYPAKVAEYADRLLLVGINYDRETKQHTCRIENYQRE